MTEPNEPAFVEPAAPGTAAPPRWLLVSLAVFLNLLWALTYPVSKAMIGDLSPLALSCWRIGGAAVLLLPFLRREDLPSKPTLRDFLLMMVMGLVGCGSAIILQYVGTERTTAANVSLIVGLETSIVVLLAAIFLAEPITRRNLFSLFLAFLGVVLLTVDPTTLDLAGSRSLWGNLLVLGSIFCYSVYTITGKLLVGRWGSTAVTVLPFVVAAVAFIPAFAWYDPSAWDRGLALTYREFVGVLFLTGIGTALGYLAWNWLLRWMSAGELSFFLYLQPLAGAVFSVWLLGEKLTTTFFLGAALILGAIVYGHQSAPAPAKSPENVPAAN